MIHHAESRIPLMLTAVMGPGHDRGRTHLRAGQPHMLPRLDQWEGTARTHGMRCWLRRDKRFVEYEPDV